MRHFHESKLSITFDLHVLSTPPAFVLSQDQTLQFYITETFSSVHSLLTYLLINLLCVCYSVFKDQLFILARRFGRKEKITNLHPGVKPFYRSLSLFRSTAATISPWRDPRNRCGLYGRTRLTVKSFFRFFKQSAPRVWTQGALLKKFRRRPTFPHSFPCSIISAVGLNFCVRDGNRCDPYAIATEKL